MASEFAQAVARRHLETTVTVGASRLMANVDAELREVREVLDALVRHQLSTGPCWCPSRVSEYGDWLTPGEHNKTCNRTRALLAALTIERDNDDK
jgi:hypothetical protein